MSSSTHTKELKEQFPAVFEMYETIMKENGYCCVDFTENISQLQTIQKTELGYILKFELFFEEMKYCPFCGEQL